jgi:hypothetical protein
MIWSCFESIEELTRRGPLQMNLFLTHLTKSYLQLQIHETRPPTKSRLLNQIFTWVDR